jgi:hypothetical protein
MGAALAMRLWAFRFQHLVTVDGTEYIRFAEALARGRAFASIFPPGYPALIAIVQALGVERVLAAQAISMASGVLLVVPVWFLARRLVGPWWSAAPALAVALHPELARFSVVTMSESAFLLLLYGALALSASSRVFASGLAMGAAFAVRPEALVSAVVLAIVGSLRGLRESAARRRLALGAAGFLLVGIPCWIWFHATLGTWTLSPKVGALHATITDWRVDERRLRIDGAPTESRGTMRLLVRNGPAALRQYPRNAAAHARSLIDLWPAPLLLLSLVGLVRRRGIEAVPLVALLLLPLLGLTRQPRFVLAAIPSLAILAAVPFGWTGRPSVRAALAVAWIAGGLWCWVGLAKPFRVPLDGSFESHRGAGLWLGTVAAPEDVVLDRKPYVAFYARRAYRVMPDEPYERLMRYAVESGARWLVVDQKVAEIFRQQLEPLLYDAAFRDRERRVELVYVGGRARGYGIGIFKVLRPGEKKSGRPPVIEAAYLSHTVEPPEPFDRTQRSRHTP